MKRTIVISLFAGIALLMLAGCQESESGSESALIQRARLVANENMQLREQLKEKDEQIAQLKENIEQLKQENIEEAQQAGDTNLRVLQIAAEAEKKNQELVQEIEKLKTELDQLKNQ